MQNLSFQTIQNFEFRRSLIKRFWSKTGLHNFNQRLANESKGKSKLEFYNLFGEKARRLQRSLTGNHLVENELTKGNTVRVTRIIEIHRKLGPWRYFEIPNLTENDQTQGRSGNRLIH